MHAPPLPSASLPSASIVNSCPGTAGATKGSTSSVSLAGVSGSIESHASKQKSCPAVGRLSPCGQIVVAANHSPMAATHFKTKFCPQILAKGSCARGVACVFAHAPEELRQPPNLARTKLCLKVKRGEMCPEANLTCLYAHKLDELRHTTDLFKTRICHLWRKGKCTAGPFCRHAHGGEELSKHRQIARSSSAGSTFTAAELLQVSGTDRLVKYHLGPANMDRAAVEAGSRTTVFARSLSGGGGAMLSPAMTPRLSSPEHAVESGNQTGAHLDSTDLNSGMYTQSVLSRSASVVTPPFQAAALCSEDDRGGVSAPDVLSELAAWLPFPSSETDAAGVSLIGDCLGDTSGPTTSPVSPDLNTDYAEIMKEVLREDSIGTSVASTATSSQQQSPAPALMPIPPGLPFGRRSTPSRTVPSTSAWPYATTNATSNAAIGARTNRTAELVYAILCTRKKMKQMQEQLESMENGLLMEHLAQYAASNPVAPTNPPPPLTALPALPGLLPTSFLETDPLENGCQELDSAALADQLSRLFEAAGDLGVMDHGGTPESFGPDFEFRGGLVGNNLLQSGLTSRDVLERGFADFVNGFPSRTRTQSLYCPQTIQRGGASQIPPPPPFPDSRSRASLASGSSSRSGAARNNSVVSGTVMDVFQSRSVREAYSSFGSESADSAPSTAAWRANGTTGVIPPPPPLNPSPVLGYVPM